MASSRGQRASLATTTETTWTPQLWGILIVLGGAVLLDGLDISMVGVALPSIRSALHMSTSSLQWIVGGYTLGYGSDPDAGRGGPGDRPDAERGRLSAAPGRAVLRPGGAAGVLRGGPVRL